MALISVSPSTRDEAGLMHQLSHRMGEAPIVCQYTANRKCAGAAAISHMTFAGTGKTLHFVLLSVFYRTAEGPVAHDHRTRVFEHTTWTRPPFEAVKWIAETLPEFVEKHAKKWEHT